MFYHLVIQLVPIIVFMGLFKLNVVGLCKLNFMKIFCAKTKFHQKENTHAVVSMAKPTEPCLSDEQVSSPNIILFITEMGKINVGHFEDWVLEHDRLYFVSFVVFFFLSGLPSFLLLLDLLTTS